MKKIFLFGRFTRIAFIISLTFFAYAMVDMTIQSQFSVKYILLTLVAFVFIIFALVWIYSLGIVIDKKENILKLILGLTFNNVHERTLNSIVSIDVVKDRNLGMNFIINYSHGTSEKIYYRFYRISFIEEIQFKRIKKRLAKLKL